MENYIRINIVNPLTFALHSGTIAMDCVIGAMEYCFRTEDMNAMNELNDAMLPFYKKYFYADPSILGHEKWEVRETIRHCMERDNGFFSWVDEEKNLLDTAYSWADYHKKHCQSYHANTFLKLLQCMAETFYNYKCIVETDIIRKELIKERIEGNAYSREIFCIMHAFITIWHEEHSSINRKVRLFKLLSRHWSFIRAIYSAMLQRVVGYGFTEIAAVAHCVKKDTHHHPYLHLFYSAVMEHRERIIHSGTKRENLDKALDALREIVTSTTPSDELDELCNILFSDKLKEYLGKHRLKSYRELENEVNTLRSNLEKNANEMQSLIDKQVEMLSETSIPIEVIYDELKNLSERFPGMAYEVYEKLNALLIKSEAWTKHSAKIRDMIWERMQQPTVQATNYYAAGANHVDYQKHLHVTNDKKQIAQS